MYSFRSIQYSKNRYLITGITGIHGWPIFNWFIEKYPEQVLGLRNCSSFPVEHPSVRALDLDDLSELQKCIEEFRPTHIIHCGGLCDLDRAENFPELAYRLNVLAAESIKKIIGDTVYPIYLSYDLVFSGDKNDGSGYTPEQSPDPLTVVGKSIVAAENIFRSIPESLIIRLALPMGSSLQGNKGAVDWILSRFKKKLPASLLYDEIRSTILTTDLGPAVDELVQKNICGLIHLGSNQSLSLYQMGEKLILRGRYPKECLRGFYRTQFPPSPPRMGNVSLNSKESHQLLEWIPQEW